MMRGKALHPGTYILLKKPWEKLPRARIPWEEGQKRKMLLNLEERNSTLSRAISL